MSPAKLRVVALVHQHLVPPAEIEQGTDITAAPWRTEYDVITTLTAMGHEVRALGVHDDLGEIRRPKRLPFPLMVKSLTQEASIGISQASVVDSDEKLKERVAFIHESIGTAAIVERYVEGRELYVGILGNDRLKVLPIWELSFTKMPEEQRKIATERLKWSLTYQKKHGIVSAEAHELPDGVAARIRDVCKRVYRNLMLTGYARIDLRLRDNGEICVMEANPNPQLARDEDFAEAARAAGLEYRALVQRILALGLRPEPSRP